MFFPLLALAALARATDFPAIEQAISSGEYAQALRMLDEARCGPDDALCRLRIPSMRGAAYLFSGDYARAEEAFQTALTLARAGRETRRIIDLLNNLGTVHFYRGEYGAALSRYRDAESALAAAPREQWLESARQLTSVNLATLFQRIGRYREALDLYRDVERQSSSLSPPERAQFLSNLAVLNRRLGDPYKAREHLRAALRLLDTRMHRDAWLGIVKNLAIVEALDFEDLRAAAGMFEQVRAEALRSGNAREAMQANLYLAETRLRQGQPGEAGLLWQGTLAESRRLSAAEDEWRSLFGQSRVLALQGRTAEARQTAEEAMRLIEKLRGRIGAPTLKSEFLADKAEVFEHAVGLAPGAADALPTFLRARALLLRESRGLELSGPPLAVLQSRLEPGERMLLYLCGRKRTSLLSLERGSATLLNLPLPEEELARAVQQLLRNPQPVVGSLAQVLLPPHSPGVRRYWIVPDGPLTSLPFELLDRGDGLLIRQAEVAYLPSAALLRAAAPASGLRWPWQPQLAAYCNPPARLSNALPGDERWPALPGSAREVEAIRDLLPGRALIYSGGGNVRDEMLSVLPGVSVAHLATHGAGDPEDPSRSRLVVGDGYLFPSHLKPAQFPALSLAVLSACETERGAFLRGEGVQSLAGAFLAAGAHTTVASLWRVNDAAATNFMRDFYRRLGDGVPVATALRETKLRFLDSGESMSQPVHWAAFVAQGAAEQPIPRVVRWSWILAPIAVALLLAAWLLRVRRREG